MNSSKPAFIATIVVFLLAVGAAVFAFWTISEDELAEGENILNDNSSFKPSTELRNEMLSEAEQLIVNNHSIITLYISDGLTPVKEPYANAQRPLGNAPEDGLYYTESDAYKTLADIESMVDATFTLDEAERVKFNLTANGSPYYSDFGKIYGEKSDGSLGINADFAEYMHPPESRADYPVNWSNTSFVITPASATECALTVLFYDNSDSDVPSFKIERTMYKLNGVWLLDKLIHEQAESSAQPPAGDTDVPETGLFDTEDDING